MFFAVTTYTFQNPGISKDYNLVFRTEISCVFHFGFREYFVTANASGQLGPKPGPGAVPRRLRFGNSFTKHRNGGKYGYHQASGFLSVLYSGFLYFMYSAAHDAVYNVSISAFIATPFFVFQYDGPFKVFNFVSIWLFLR